ncbi:MAG TPA: hypothetical protein VGE16_00015 [Albitalea sp.]
MSAAQPPSPAVDPLADKNASPALQRLAESRERLRQRMLRADGRHQARRRNAAAEAEGQEPSALDKLRALPVIGVIVDTLADWWSQHPLHSAAQMAQDAVGGVVAPVTRRHPLAAVAVAFAAGGLLIWLRPWRLLKPAVFAGVASQVASRLVAQVPIESLVAAFIAFASTRLGSDEEEEPSADAQPATAGAHTPHPLPAEGVPRDAVIH